MTSSHPVVSSHAERMVRTHETSPANVSLNQRDCRRTGNKKLDGFMGDRVRNKTRKSLITLARVSIASRVIS